MMPSHKFPPTTIVIDDDEEFAQGLADWFGAHGESVMAAYDAPSGLDLIREHRPRLILVDLQMPLMDGYTLVQTLRASPEFDGTRIYALTGMDDLSTVRAIVAGGFTGHIGKPLYADTLDAVLRYASEPALTPASRNSLYTTKPAACADDQAHWKLNPPRWPVTSTTSPMK